MSLTINNNGTLTAPTSAANKVAKAATGTLQMIGDSLSLDGLKRGANAVKETTGNALNVAVQELSEIVSECKSWMMRYAMMEMVWSNFKKNEKRREEETELARAASHAETQIAASKVGDKIDTTRRQESVAA